MASRLAAGSWSNEKIEIDGEGLVSVLALAVSAGEFLVSKGPGTNCG